MVWLIYLQFLFAVGQFNTKKNWIDRHILLCYDKLEKLNAKNIQVHKIDYREMEKRFRREQ